MDVALATIDEAQDAMKFLSAALPAPDVAFSHGVPSDDPVHISVEEFRLLTITRDGMTLNDLITANTAATVDSMRIVRQLMERGLLVAGPTG
jgi:hypothetical protein